MYSVNTNYLSKTVYNELISIMANLVKKEFFDQKSSAKFFSMINDECKDISNAEQLSLCVRYSGLLTSSTSQRDHFLLSF